VYYHIVAFACISDKQRYWSMLRLLDWQTQSQNRKSRCFFEDQKVQSEKNACGVIIIMKTMFKEAAKSSKVINFPIVLRNACPIILNMVNIV
jgi:hypothetical protein